MVYTSPVPLCLLRNPYVPFGGKILTGFSTQMESALRIVFIPWYAIVITAKSNMVNACDFLDVVNMI